MNFLFADNIFHTIMGYEQAKIVLIILNEESQKTSHTSISYHIIVTAIYSF